MTQGVELGVIILALVGILAVIVDAIINPQDEKH